MGATGEPDATCELHTCLINEQVDLIRSDANGQSAGMVDFEAARNSPPDTP